MMGTEKELTPKQAAFVQEYLIDLNGTQAAIRAGYSPKTANEQASRLLANVNIQNALAAAKKARVERLEIEQDIVLKPLLQTIQADPNELVEHRRVCCRYCYGEAHRYQFTPAEWEKALEEHEHKRQTAIKTGYPDPGPLGMQGGIGYDPRKPPVPDCPECFGDGDSRVFFKDTRSLSEAARALYAGTEISKGSIKINMHSKEKAAEMLGRHIGAWNDSLKLKGSKDDPIALFLMQLASGNGNGLPVVQNDPDNDE